MFTSTGIICPSFSMCFLHIPIRVLCPCRSSPCTWSSPWSMSSTPASRSWSASRCAPLPSVRVIVDLPARRCRSRSTITGSRGRVRYCFRRSSCTTIKGILRVSTAVVHLCDEEPIGSRSQRLFAPYVDCTSEVIRLYGLGSLTWKLRNLCWKLT